MPIFANVGVPMIFIHWPLMLRALVPVIIVEALLIRRWVSLFLRDAFIGIGKASVFSTLVGVPLAWLAMLALAFAVILPFGLAADKWKWESDGPVWQVLRFLFSVAWLSPDENSLHWMVPAAIALLLVPCFIFRLALNAAPAHRVGRPRSCTSSSRGVRCQPGIIRLAVHHSL